MRLVLICIMLSEALIFPACAHTEGLAIRSAPELRIL